MSKKQKIEIDGAKLFWDMAFQAYRAKVWYDFGVATKQFGKTVFKQTPGLIEFTILGSIWIIIISVLLPFRVFAASVFISRWCYYIPHRRRIAKAARIVRKNREIRHRRQQTNYIMQQQDKFSLDKFCSTFE